jgi:hypothetical protein
MILTDQNGNKTEVKAVFAILKDSSLPTASNMSVVLSNFSLLGISGNIKAPNKIASVTLEIQSAASTREISYTDAAIVGQTEIVFSKTVDMSSFPAGHYHINITILDQAGKSVVYSYHMDKS